MDPSQEELPPYDGLYEVTNHAEKQYDLEIVEYDGFGFVFDKAYRNPKYWRYLKQPEKKYGKQYCEICSEYALNGLCKHDFCRSIAKKMVKNE